MCRALFNDLASSHTHLVETEGDCRLGLISLQFPLLLGQRVGLDGLGGPLWPADAAVHYDFPRGQVSIGPELWDIVLRRVQDTAS